MGILKKHLDKLTDDEKKYISEVMSTSSKLISEGKSSEALKYLRHNIQKTTKNESNHSK